MRSLWFLAPVLFVIACGGSRAAEPPAAAPPSAPAASAIVPPGEAKVGDRTTCLVSKEEFVVKADSPKVDHEGKTYYFCCEGCDEKFKADPKKYLGK